MKIFKAILAFIGGLFLFSSLAIVGLEIYASIDKQDTFYLKNAQFSNFDYLTDLDKEIESKGDLPALREEMNVYVHRLSEGTGSVFAYRWYTNGDAMTIDDERFKKITIWISSLPKSFPANYEFDSEKIIKAAYTSGGSAWPSTACSGYIKSGAMSLYKSGSTYTVRIKGTVYPSGSGSYGDYCKEQEIEYEFSASEIEFSELTPWLGLKGNHPYAETYR